MSQKLMACELIQGKKYLINGNLEKIVKLIPIQESNLGDIYDLEILLDKERNKYFSYNMYLKDMSWVKDIKKI